MDATTSSTAYGAQALALLLLFGDSLDETLLRARLREEGAEDALEALRRLAAQEATVDEASLARVLDEIHSTPDAP